MRNALIILLVCALGACAGTGRQVKPQLVFDPPSAEFEGLQVGRMEQWSMPLPANAEVEIINPHGDVYIRHNRGGSNVGISGVVQRLGHDPAVEHIDLRAGKDSVRLEVSYPRGIDTTPDGFERPGRVDLAVLVPQGTTLRVQTRDGVITGKRVRANIHARSESGLINLSTTGWMDLASDTGRVQMVLIGDRWNHEHKAATRSGSIEVEFPTKAPLSVHARTGGNFKVEPEALAEHLVVDGNTLSGHWGDAPAAHRIDAESESGDITFTLYGWMRESVADAPTDPSR